HSDPTSRSSYHVRTPFYRDCLLRQGRQAVPPRKLPPCGKPGPITLVARLLPALSAEIARFLRLVSARGGGSGRRGPFEGHQSFWRRAWALLALPSLVLSKSAKPFSRTSALSGWVLRTSLTTWGKIAASLPMRPPLAYLCRYPLARSTPAGMRSGTVWGR